MKYFQELLISRILHSSNQFCLRLKHLFNHFKYSWKPLKYGQNIFNNIFQSKNIILNQLPQDYHQYSGTSVCFLYPSTWSSLRYYIFFIWSSMVLLDFMDFLDFIGFLELCYFDHITYESYMWTHANICMTFAISYILRGWSLCDSCRLQYLSLLSRCFPRTWQTYLSWPNILPSFDYSRKSPPGASRHYAYLIARLDSLDPNGSKSASFLKQDPIQSTFDALARTCAPSRMYEIFSLRGPKPWPSRMCLG